jgi:methionine-rich copper-binding protein CopC
LPLFSPLGRTCRRTIASIAAFVALGLLLPNLATAHAVVVTSAPAAGAALAAPPPNVTIRFNSRLDHARSRLLLIGADGAQTVLQVAPDSDPTVLEAPVPAVGPGPWRLRWQVLAVDGHITRGDIPFTIQQGR